jgi:hypothetical protein
MNDFGKFLFMPSLFLLCFTGLAQRSRSFPSTRDPKLPVLRGTEPIEIVGAVIAHDEHGGLGVGSVDDPSYVDFLIIRVKKVMKGAVSTKYVRADFLGGADNELPKSLIEGKQWRMRLEPGIQGRYRVCDWTIPPYPRPGDVQREFLFIPRLVPVGPAKNFPDINALRCYALERKNLQEIAPSDDESSRTNSR